MSIYNRSNAETFIEKSLTIGSNKEKYDYNLVDYTNNKTKVTIICLAHGEFQQTPDAHLKGQGCPYCGASLTGNKKKKRAELLFVAKANKIKTHKEKNYDYSNFVYVNSRTKSVINCPKHGLFEQTPNDHLSGYGCARCGGFKKLSQVEFIARSKTAHKNEPLSYEKVEFKNTKTKVIITCLVPNHGDFEQEPSKHMRGAGCPKCKLSHGERKVQLIFEELEISTQRQYRIPACKNKIALPFDFAIIKNATLLGLVEYQGKQHYSPHNFGSNSIDKHQKLKEIQFRDNIKKDFCLEHQIPLLLISYKDKNMKNTILQFLRFVNSPFFISHC